MTAPVTPQAALFGSERALPALPPCVHYAGSEKFLRKALELQNARGPAFDIAGDCEDGAPIGAEAAHAKMVAGLIRGDDNRHCRFGARIHDPQHPAWSTEVAILIQEAGEKLAFLTIPKAESASDVERVLRVIAAESARCGLRRPIAVSVLIETPAAVEDAWRIAALPGVASLDFGTLDFVSCLHGAVPLSAMESPGQFDHALLRRAKAEVAAAALAHGVVPVHGVTRALDDPERVYEDACRARDEFGFLRMWSIHPSQIDPIVRAFAPDPGAVAEAAAVLAAARAAAWAPLRVAGKLHDRASYRYCWSLLRRAHAAGTPLPAVAHGWFNSAAQ